MRNIMIGLAIIMLGVCAYAITIGVEPPSTYMNALKICKAGTFNQQEPSGLNLTYKIKGKLPNGRCEVTFSNFTDFSNKATYDNFISVSKSFAKSFGAEINESDFPTQAQMIEQGKKEGETYTCRFSDKERQDLYNAYLKHDSKNPPAKVSKDSISISFDSSKISSYDKLMQKYYLNGPCNNDVTMEEDGKNVPVKKYVCEYADTTCYVTLYQMSGGNGSSVSCSGKRDVDDTRWEIVKKHAESGKCSKLF